MKTIQLNESTYKIVQKYAAREDISPAKVFEEAFNRLRYRENSHELSACQAIYDLSKIRAEAQAAYAAYDPEEERVQCQTAQYAADALAHWHRGLVLRLIFDEEDKADPDQEFLKRLEGELEKQQTMYLSLHSKEEYEARIIQYDRLVSALARFKIPEAETPEKLESLEITDADYEEAHKLAAEQSISVAQVFEDAVNALLYLGGAFSSRHDASYHTAKTLIANYKGGLLRLEFRESDRPEPDQALIDHWNEESFKANKDLDRLYAKTVEEIEALVDKYVNLRAELKKAYPDEDQAG